MKTRFVKRLAVLSMVAACAGLLGGCATSGNPKDPIEGYNRAMFAINEGLDSVIIKPVAQGYETVLPTPVRNGVANFFGNIDDVFIGVNNLLQGKVPEAFGDAGRVLVNTTIGLLGVLDVATEIGLEKHDEDFGQTLGRWGVGNGAYIVLPFFGPRTLRDTAGLALDMHTDPVSNEGNVATRNTLLATRIVSDRAQLLGADKIVDEAALDRYSYIRDAYLQRRRSLIHDGNPPREVFDDAAAPVVQRLAATPRLVPVSGAANLFVLRDESELEGAATAAQPEVAAAAEPADASAMTPAPAPVLAEAGGN